MARDKKPVRLHELTHSRATWATMHPKAGDLPGSFVLEFREASGPAVLSDGRALIAALTPAELAEALGSIPVLSLTGDDENIRALVRVVDLLRGRAGTTARQENDHEPA